MLQAGLDEKHYHSTLLAILATFLHCLMHEHHSLHDAEGSPATSMASTVIKEVPNRAWIFLSCKKRAPGRPACQEGQISHKCCCTKAAHVQ